MARIPDCPNHVEGRCPRSELIFLSEDEKCFRFHCRTCKLFWAVSKPKHADYARELNRIKKLEELSEKERGRIATFYAPAGGWK